MERYQHIIRAGLFGHTHDQYWAVTQSVSNPDKNIGVLQIGPSATTGMFENPGYALLEVDEETLLPINWKIYAMDLDKANASGTPDWEMMIDYVQDYQLGGISPDSLYDMAARLTTDQDFYWQINWDKTRRVGEYTQGNYTEWLEQSKDAYCSYTSSSHEQQAQCNGSVGSPTDALIGTWKKLLISGMEQFLN